MAPSPLYIIRKSSLLEDGMLASYSVVCTDAKKEEKNLKDQVEMTEKIISFQYHV